MEEVTRCTGIITFPYCLNVLLNLWIRPMDLSCSGSISRLSSPGRVGPPVPEPAEPASPAPTAWGACAWVCGGGWASSSLGCCLGCCTARLATETDSCRWEPAARRGERSTQQQSGPRRSEPEKCTDRPRIADTCRKTWWERTRCIILFFPSPSSPEIGNTKGRLYLQHQVLACSDLLCMLTRTLISSNHLKIAATNIQIDSGFLLCTFWG